MKLIETSAELLPFIAGEDGIYKMIERAGRTCYKSTDKMTDDSAKPFVERMIKSGHTAMLEHGTVYLAIPYTDEEALSHYRGVAGKYNEVEFTRYSKVTMMRGTHNYVTTNYRVLVENNWLDDLKYLCEPTTWHEKRYTFRMVTSIGVTRELNRHRVNSIAEQSTRYCNYAKDKFGNEITVCKPYWLDDNREFKNSEAYNNAYELFYSACEEAEGYYMTLIDEGFSPQQAREVLPLCTASEIIHTAFASDWRFFFDLRLFAKTGNPHPNMLLLAQKMKAEAEDKDVWNDIMRYHSKF